MGSIPAKTVDAVAAATADVADALHATWHRAVPVDGHPVPMFATSTVTR